MFKNIQKYLLINHPLLWNTKVIPATAVLLIINIIFFIIGYNDGQLDFNESENNYNYDNEATVIFFSIFLSILFIIIWLVYYLKNNSFKSFYPQYNFSLFKEWLVIFFIGFLTSLFTFSYLFGADVRVRGYYSEKEAKERCATLSMGSYFVDGSYSNNYSDDGTYTAVVEQPVVDAVTTVDSTGGYRNDSIVFKGKHYNYFSLMNKNLNSYTFFDYKTDSLHKLKMKTWLANQENDSIKLLFKKYLAIAKEHNLKANIDENKWFSLIESYPDFNDYKLIGNSGNGEYYYGQQSNVQFDSVNKYLKDVTLHNNTQTYEYYRHYVPEKELNYNYDKISEAYTSPNFSFITVLIALHIGLGISLVLFSFRVTSGRSWLIAVVSLGILNILFGIFTLILGNDYTYAVLLMLTTIFCVIYFFVTLVRKKGKNISGILINAMLWLIPGFFPIIYYIVLQILQRNSYAYPEMRLSPHYETIRFMEDNAVIFFYLNFAFVVLMMVLFSFKIKKWRGLAEG